MRRDQSKLDFYEEPLNICEILKTDQKVSHNV